MILDWWDLYGMDLVHMVAGRGIGMTPLFAPKSISQLTAISATVGPIDDLQHAMACPMFSNPPPNGNGIS